MGNHAEKIFALKQEIKERLRSIAELEKETDNYQSDEVTVVVNVSFEAALRKDECLDKFFCTWKQFCDKMRGELSTNPFYFAEYYIKDYFHSLNVLSARIETFNKKGTPNFE